MMMRNILFFSNDHRHFHRIDILLSIQMKVHGSAIPTRRAMNMSLKNVGSMLGQGNEIFLANDVLTRGLVDDEKKEIHLFFYLSLSLVFAFSSVNKYIIKKKKAIVARNLFSSLMLSNKHSPSNQTEDLLDRLILFEKLIELKSNECAYYRTKVHLMQMNSTSKERTVPSKEIQRRSSSSSSLSTEQNSINHSKHRRNSIPNLSPGKSILKTTLSNSSIPFRSSNKFKRRIYAQNQNHSAPPLVLQDKTIQCTDQDFHSIDQAPPRTILKIRLPHRFVRSLQKSSSPKLKVHLSSQLLNKLFQSMHSIEGNHFTIQSQFGKIAACIDQQQQQQPPPRRKTIHVKAEMKTHSNDQLPIVRHLARKLLPSEKKKKTTHHHRHRSKKRHIRKSSSTSHEQSKRSSTATNLSRSTETRSSTDQTSNSIVIETPKQKSRKINLR